MVGKVPDSDNQVRYQRVRAFAARYRLIVITASPFPEQLRASVAEVHIATDAKDMGRVCFSVCKRLSDEGQFFFLHTQYALPSMVIGALCKLRFGCKWVYDLWDHPSLSWSASHGIRHVSRRLFWAAIGKGFTRRADLWVIAMHPAVLSHLPTPRRECRLIFASPGFVGSCAEGEREPRVSDQRAQNEISICYAGTVSLERGVDVILDWASKYSGPPIRLDLIGPHNQAVSTAVEGISAGEDPRIRILLHGRLPHQATMQIIRNSDIGLCLLNPEVLNYRYAYPIKIFEYMSLGLVTVASDGYGVRTFIRDGENGLITGYSTEAFARTMDAAIAVARSPERKRWFAANASRTVAGRDWRTMNDDLLAQLDPVVEAWRDGARRGRAAA